MSPATRVLHLGIGVDQSGYDVLMRRMEGGSGSHPSQSYSDAPLRVEINPAGLVPSPVVVRVGGSTWALKRL